MNPAATSPLMSGALDGGMVYTRKAGGPAVFLLKLWDILENANFNGEAIAWCATGEGFEVKDQKLMAEKVLPIMFRHNNFASFQRQLNYFGFRKKDKTTRGTVYAHPLWRQSDQGMLPPKVSIVVLCVCFHTG